MFFFLAMGSGGVLRQPQIQIEIFVSDSDLDTCDS